MKLNRKRVKKKIISFNFTALFFFLLSCISLTFAWFAYNNVVKTNIEIGVSAWHIELKDGEEEISYELLVPINEFYPGIDKFTKTIEILNKGDIDAEFSYNISSLRILDEEYIIDNQPEIFDKLAHEYPFLFNIEVDSNFLASGESIMLNIVADWPLDSGNDLLDSKWGNDSYNFIEQEKNKKLENPDYEIRSVIEIMIELNTKQYVEDNKEITDNRYLYGNVYNYDINSITPCNTGASCYNFYVIDKNNLISNDRVKLMMSSTYNINSGSYNYIKSLETEKLKLPTAELILEGISRDIFDTNIVMENISKRIVGNITYNNRNITLLNSIASENGYIEFNANYFNHLTSDECYWTNTPYNDNMMYAIKRENLNTVKLYGENINSNCKFIPVIEIVKESN